LVRRPNLRQRPESSTAAPQSKYRWAALLCLHLPALPTRGQQTRHQTPLMHGPHGFLARSAPHFPLPTSHSTLACTALRCIARRPCITAATASFPSAAPDGPSNISDHAKKQKPQAPRSRHMIPLSHWHPVRETCLSHTCHCHPPSPTAIPCRPYHRSTPRRRTLWT
jgi:hypothetical protein